MIKTIDRPDQSYAEWQIYRDALGKTGIGGSEAASVFSLSKWSPISKLYYLKIGEEIVNEPTIYTYGGTYSEASIRELYQYYPENASSAKEGTLEMYENFYAGNKVRECVEDPRTYTNSDLPNCFVNLDGVDRLENPTLISEFKSTTSQATKAHVHGFDLAYMVQVQFQMMIAGVNKAHLFQRIDGVTYELYPIEPLQEMRNEIAIRVSDFWGLVKEARAVKKEYGIDRYVNVDMRDFSKKQMEGVGLLQSLEPDLVTPEDSEWVNKWLEAAIEKVELPGKEEVMNLALQRDAIKKEIKILDTSKNEVEVELKKLFQEKGATHFFFPSGDKTYKVSYTKDRLGRNKMYVSPNIDKFYEL